MEYTLWNAIASSSGYSTREKNPSENHFPFQSHYTSEFPIIAERD